MASANVTTSAALAVPANPERKVLMIQNLSDTHIYIGFSASVTAADGANSGIQIPANGGMIAMPDLPVRTTSQDQDTNDVEIYAVHAGSGTKQLRYLEI